MAIPGAPTACCSGGWEGRLVLLLCVRQVLVPGCCGDLVQPRAAAAAYCCMGTATCCAVP